MSTDHIFLTTSAPSRKFPRCTRQILLMQNINFPVGLNTLKLAFMVTLTMFAQELYSDSFENDIVKAAHDRTDHNVRYDGAYISIGYPNGDVPSNMGVCTDVVIRSYRALGTDLQKLVHEDISNNFGQYPSKRIWGLSKPDRNIDHRRVPNLQTFFQRHGISLPITNTHSDYKSGDLVTWVLPGNLPHIGIVVDKMDPDSGNPLIVHNIGRGPKMQDMLFNFEITGHFRYVPTKYSQVVK